MNQLMAMNNEVTMSSREIAELVGKEHKHVMRDLRVLSEQLGDMFEGVVQVWTHPQNKQQYEEYAIKRDTCITLLTGYDSVSRMKVIKRWQELESARKPAIPQTYAAALLEAGRLAMELEQAEAQLAIAAPKAEFVDRYVDATGTYGFRQVAKMLSVKENWFSEFLVDKGIMYRLSGKLTAHSDHIDAGRFVARAGVAKNDHAYTECRFTSKGVEWVAGEIAKHKAAESMRKGV
ncbi:regulatory protein/antirepressor [Aeromonas phage phiA005]|nr:regulatory protein/antirepressor [Aeromonas phage phiA005]